MKIEDFIKQLDSAKLFLNTMWIPQRASELFNDYRLSKGIYKRTITVLSTYIIE